MTKTLNAWLGKNLMGWKYKSVAYGSGGSHKHWVNADGKTVDRNREGFHPDTDHNDAFKVVEALGEREYWFTMNKLPNTYTEVKFIKYDLANPGGYDDEIVVSCCVMVVHNSTPRAICLAAYKAIDGREWSDEV